MPHSDSSFILIVDDSSTNLSILAHALKSAGYKVRIAMDGEDALEQVEHERPELILLDIQMPKLDGFETCRRLQSNPQTQGIPIIFMTALADTENKLKGLALGAVDYVTKPFETEEVLARVKIHWRLKQLTDSLEQQVLERTQGLQEAQIKLVQQEKLSALGELVSGVAHEINNPVGCIVGNISALSDYMNDLLGAISLYEKRLPEPDLELQEELDNLDLDYLRNDLPKLFKSMQDGANRIKNISQSLRIFSRSDGDVTQEFNLHEGIDSTLLILNHRLKANEQRPAIEVVTEYGQIPNLSCFPGQINQVLMNLLANAIDAFEESERERSFEEISRHPHRITIATEATEERVFIRIADNGAGIPQNLRERIFEQGFTTKQVGKGTGLGLAIAKQIIEDKHQGTLTFQSQPGSGTEFVIALSR